MASKFTPLFLEALPYLHALSVSIRIHSNYRELHIIRRSLLYLFAALGGGGIVLPLLTGNPIILLTPSPLTTIYIAIFAIIAIIPQNAVNSIENYGKPIMKIVDGIVRARAICTVPQHYASSPVSTVLAAIIVGNGGGWLIEATGADKQEWQWKFPSSLELDPYPLDLIFTSAIALLYHNHLASVSASCAIFIAAKMWAQRKVLSRIEQSVINTADAVMTGLPEEATAKSPKRRASTKARPRRGSKKD